MLVVRVPETSVQNSSNKVILRYCLELRGNPNSDLKHLPAAGFVHLEQYLQISDERQCKKIDVFALALNATRS